LSPTYPDINVITDSTTTTIIAVPATAIYGDEESTSFTVTVTTGGGETLPFSGETATVSVAAGTCTATLVPGDLGGTGSCSLAATALPAGSYSAVATYDGDADLAGSRSASIPFTVAKATSSAVLTLSAATVAYGDEQVEVLSVIASAEFAGSSPSGTITVTASTTTVCVITLSGGTGPCTLSAEQLGAGSYQLLATYGGDGNFKGSVAAKKTLRVTG
jgi:hypothetical protein